MVLFAYYPTFYFGEKSSCFVHLTLSISPLTPPSGCGPRSPGKEQAYLLMGHQQSLSIKIVLLLSYELSKMLLFYSLDECHCHLHPT